MSDSLALALPLALGLGLTAITASCSTDIGDTDDIDNIDNPDDDSDEPESDIDVPKLISGSESVGGTAPDPGMAPTSFDFERLLEDDQLLGGEQITVEIVQEFLDSEGSFLADYIDPVAGVSAANIIANRSHAYGVSPLYMLARIQTESSLVSSGSSINLEAATGCGCPDGLGCNPELGGFGNQVECAAMKLRGYYDDLDAGNPTIAGWNVGESHASLDPCDIVPANKATAALYTYTPWVGAYTEDCGRSDVGGSSLVALIYYRFAFARAWPGIQ